MIFWNVLGGIVTIIIGCLGLIFRNFLAEKMPTRQWFKSPNEAYGNKGGGVAYVVTFSVIIIIIGLVILFMGLFNIPIETRLTRRSYPN